MATDQFISGPILEEYVKNLTDRLIDDYSNQLFFGEYPKPDFHSNFTFKPKRPRRNVTSLTPQGIEEWTQSKPNDKLEMLLDAITTANMSFQETYKPTSHGKKQKRESMTWKYNNWGMMTNNRVVHHIGC
jgi:hypothetical protein